MYVPLFSIYDFYVNSCISSGHQKVMVFLDLVFPLHILFSTAICWCSHKLYSQIVVFKSVADPVMSLFLLQHHPIDCPLYTIFQILLTF